MKLPEAFDLKTAFQWSKYFSPYIQGLLLKTIAPVNYFTGAISGLVFNVIGILAGAIFMFSAFINFGGLFDISQGLIALILRLAALSCKNGFLKC